jgi:hypothetical protein
MNNSRGSKDRRVILPLFSDTQGGSVHGLMDPDTTWQEITRSGEIVWYKPALNDIQIFLDLLYKSHIKRCFDLAGEDEVAPLFGGDITDGIKHADPDTLTMSVARQQAIALKLLYPWLECENVKRFRMAEGTSAHEFDGAGMAYMIAEYLKAKYPTKDIGVVQHGLIDIDGFTIDYAHHRASPGKRHWLKGNEARYYLRDIMNREIMQGRRPPDVVWGSHYHEPVIEELRVNGHKSTLIITPSYSFPGAWTRQATKSVYEIANGMMVLEVIGGKLVDIHEYIERSDIRTREYF